MVKSYRNQVLFSVLGLFVGYLILHPYTMVVAMIAHLHKQGNLDFSLQELATKALHSFQAEMLMMAMPFAFFGGLTGFLIGMIMDRKKRLLELKYESEKNELALQTVKEVMVTLSHHLLNANMIIGGKVRHCRKLVSDEDIVHSLQVIEEQGHRIDAVIKALRNVSEVKTTDYTTSGQVKMIDISEEIDEEIKQIQDRDSS